LARIKAIKLRGVLSIGLLVPAPDGAAEGDDVAEPLGITHYKPPVGPNSNKDGLVTGGEATKAPHVYAMKYDLEASRLYAAQVFRPGESIMNIKKLHGENARYVYRNGEMYCGSRTEWKKQYPSYDHVTVESLLATGKVDAARAEDIVAKLSRQAEKPTRNLWWQVLRKTPALELFCVEHPGVVVYGEVYGAVQDLTYGHAKGDASFAAFDVLNDGYWMHADESRALLEARGVPCVPLAARVPFDFDRICELAEGPSLVSGADCVREGVVVKPLEERHDDKLGRVCLKWIGCSYLERSKLPYPLVNLVNRPRAVRVPLVVRARPGVVSGPSVSRVKRH
jgi:RNA ligase (TIGR02306 family)